MAAKSKKICVTIFGSSTQEQKFYKNLMADSELNKFIGFEKTQSPSDRLKFLASEYLILMEAKRQKMLVAQKRVKEKTQLVKTETEIKTNEIEL